MNAQTQPPRGGILAGLSDDNVTRGTIAKWTKETGWVTREGQPIQGPVLVIGFVTVLRRWKDGRPYYKTSLPLPDPEELNKAIPISEWENGLDGRPTPPWRACYVFYFINTTSGALYTLAQDHSFGVLLCYQALEEACLVMQMLRGANVLPVAQLSKAPWKSARWGPQTRPHFEIIDWRELPVAVSGGNLAAPTPTPQLSAPTAAAPAPRPVYPSPTPSTPAEKAAAIAAKAPLFPGKPVKPVTTAEAIADELPAHSAPPKNEDLPWR